MTLLAEYVHDLNPIAIPLPDWPFVPAGIRWYGLSYLLGFVIAYLLIRRVTRVGRSTVKPEEVGDMIVTMAIGVVLGGRLGYVTFYMPSLWGFVDHFPYWGVLAINQGGMSFHGGMLGAVLGALWFAKRGSPARREGEALSGDAEPRVTRKNKRKNGSAPPG